MGDPVRAILRYLKIEDAEGINFPSIALYGGCAASLFAPRFGLAAVLAGLLGFHVERYQGHRRALRAMETNERVALAKRSDDADGLSERLEKVEEKVKLLATPEQAKILQDFADKWKKRVGG